MNLLRSILRPFNRRVSDESFKVEKRGSLSHRLNAASDRVDTAIEDLCKTVSMKREDFEELMRKEIKK